MCSFKVELGGGPGGLAMRAESADLWHRRMGHIKRKSTDVLRRTPGSGVDYNGDTQACDVGAVGKSKQQAHPKQATYDVHHAFQLVTVDLMGPIEPAALGQLRNKVRRPTHQVEGDISHQDETASTRCSRAVQQGTCDSEQHAFDSSQGGQRYGDYEL